MRHGLFSFPFFIGITAVLFLTINYRVFSFTPEEEAVFEKAQRSLEAYQNQSSIGSNFIQTVNKTSESGGLTLVNTYSFYDTSGYFHLTGEVINRSPDAMQNVRAVATFYDASKNVVGTNTGYVQPEIINTGSKGAFVISGPDPTPSKESQFF